MAGNLVQALDLSDKLVGQDNFEYLNAYELPPTRERYRQVADNNRGKWPATYSTHTRTEWTFTSAATDGTATLPLIQLDYAVALDDAGRAAHTAKVTVTAQQLPRVTAKPGRPQVEVSYDDGRTWKTAVR